MIIYSSEGNYIQVEKEKLNEELSSQIKLDGWMFSVQRRTLHIFVGSVSLFPFSCLCINFFDQWQQQQHELQPLKEIDLI